MKMEVQFDKTIFDEVDEFPYPLLFATISGAHLYGFPSPDSDFDLRGTHILPVAEVVTLDIPQETISVSHVRNGLEIDLVAHDVKKFFSLMLKKNGYVLEQLYSPLIVRSSPEHEELKALGVGCITRFHVHHYLGFAKTQWSLFGKSDPPEVKPLLYVFRVILTGIHLMRTGEVQANLVTLNESFKLPYIAELVDRKLTGTEHGTLQSADLDFYQSEYDRLTGVLFQSHEESKLPEVAVSRSGLNDLLLRVRMASLTDPSPRSV